MRKIGVFEAKSQLSSLLDEVQAGHTITIVKHGQPVAILAPAVVPVSRWRWSLSALQAALRTLRGLMEPRAR